MRFKLDENMPALLKHDFAIAGHDAQTCEDEGIAGVEDPVLAAHARVENRILVTFNLDFSDIRCYPPGSHPGMVIFRLQSQDFVTCRAACARLLQAVPEADFTGTLIVVEDKRVRIRRPQP